MSGEHDSKYMYGPTSSQDVTGGGRGSGGQTQSGGPREVGWMARGRTSAN